MCLSPAKDGRSLVKVKFSMVFALAVGVLIVSVPLFAHHGNASYDLSKMVTVTGTVTEYIWANPHVFLKLDAKDDSGNTLHWTIEAQNPVSQLDVGWSKNTFKPGVADRFEKSESKLQEGFRKCPSASWFRWLP